MKEMQTNTGGAIPPENPTENPLGTEKISRLLMKFAIPSIIAMLVSALYNIVDQIFVGNSVGMLGNAATNVAFPLSTICIALALLFGIGGATNFNLSMGAGNPAAARKYIGNAISLLSGFGILLGVCVFVFVEPLVRLCGATDPVMPYALTYTSISAVGFPFLVFSTGFCAIIRSDGSPKYSMVCMLVGAILNTILDPLFIFAFDMGIAGAAWATVIGQIASALVALFYIRRLKTVQIGWKDLVPSIRIALRLCALGISNCLTQLAMMVVQVVTNNVLTFYGAQSVYGSEIPLTCAGIISKVSMIILSIIIGISQGLQPIISFNYGAKHYRRVREAYLMAVLAGTAVSILATLVFLIFPRQIALVFGSGSNAYLTFFQQYCRIYLFCTFLNALQPISSNFFTAIGKASIGTFLSLTRQTLFLLPLILLLPMAMGIEGVMFAGPIADFIAAAVTVAVVIPALRKIKKLEQPVSEPLAAS